MHQIVSTHLFRMLASFFNYSIQFIVFAFFYQLLAHIYHDTKLTLLVWDVPLFLDTATKLFRC